MISVSLSILIGLANSTVLRIGSCIVYGVYSKEASISVIEKSFGRLPVATGYDSKVLLTGDYTNYSARPL